MTSRRLPESPSLTHLRKLARELQRGVRTGDPAALRTASLDAAVPDFALNRAQRALAHEYGFASWPRLHQHVAAIEERSWTATPAPADEPAADRYLRTACLAWDGTRPDRAAGAAVLAQNPGLARTSPAVAAVLGDVDAVRAHLAADPASATRTVGPHGWSPLMYLAYARTDAAAADVLAIAGALLDAGADPDDGRFFLGLPTPFTLLTGVVGGGERGEPPHPHWRALARLLLERGADPNDGQLLYNRMFDADDAPLELLLEFGLGRGDGGPWRRRLPDLLDPPAELLRALLGWAVTHDQRDRVALLARHGVDVRAPLAKVGPLDVGRTPLAIATANGHDALAALLRELGATDDDLDPVESLIGALLAGDVPDPGADLLAAARRRRPALVVWAVAQGRADAAERLVGLGWDVDALGRSDVPVEQPWETALHAAVARGDADLVRRLVALGADRDVRDRRFDSTPAGWAEHLGHPELLPLLA